MAFTKDNLISDGEIEVIVRKDSALNVTDEQYAEYLKDLDESKLVLKAGEEPTKFVLKKNIPLKHATRIENSKVKYTKGEVELQLGFIIEEVRATLKDIKNPPSVPRDKWLEYKQSGDGLVEDTLMGQLIGVGVIQDLYTARRNYIDNMGGDHTKK